MEESYASLLDSIRPLDLLQDGSAGMLPLPEEIELQAMWFNGQFGRNFITTCGKKVVIKQFGFWNRSSGPDFLHASIEIDSEERAGPLEIDTKFSDWEQHGHDVNSAFNETILHVIFESSDKDHFTRTSDHREVPKVVVPVPCIQAALKAPLSMMAPMHLGRCYKPLANSSISRVQALLEQAARHRSQIKARRHQAILDSHGRDQALWVELAETMGYRPNRLSMTLLAQRLPIKDLRRSGDRMMALCYGVAGFLNPDIHNKAPQESRDWLENLWEKWWKERLKYELDEVREIQWVMHGNRPVNHPHRRLASLVVIARHWPIFRKLSEQPKELMTWLASLEDPFWSVHYTLISKLSKKKLALMGKDRISELMMNHILPRQIAEDNQGAWKMYCAIPAPAVNEKVKRAHYRLFGDRKDAKQVLLKSWHHQALLQIYQDFCLVDTSDCESCAFPEQLSRF